MYVTMNKTVPFRTIFLQQTTELINTIKIQLPAEDDLIPIKPQIYNYFIPRSAK